MEIGQKKYTIFQNIKWYLKKASKKFPKLKYGLLVNTFNSLILLLATSGVPTLIVWGLQEKLNFLSFSLLILAVCIGLGCLLWEQSVYKTWLTWENANLRLQLTVDDGMGFLMSPFEESIDTTIQKQRATSSKHGYQDDDSGVDVLWPNFANLGATLVSICIIAALTVMIKWWIPIIILAIALLSGLLLVKLNEHQRQLKASLDNSNFVQKYLYQEAFKLDAGKDIRLYNLRGQYKKKIDVIYRESVKTQQKINRQRVRSIWLICVLDTFQLLFVYVPLVVRVCDHSMTLPTFTFFLTLLGTLSALVRKGATEFSQMIMANEDVSIGRKYLDYVDQMPSQSEVGIAKEKIGKVEEIEFRNVSYHYSNNSKDIIKNMSFTIKKNATIALVGLNGAGKTTLISLLMGLLTPTEGTILINGIPVGDFDLRAYMQLFSPIFQSGATFADTVKKNVTFNNQSDLSFNTVIEKSGLATVIKQLNEGKNTNLTQYVDDKGVSLSGGQSQKLMLARALYKNGQVLVLDEPTAALDSLAESNLYRQYQELAANKISIFISHRLASTQFADTIFFIKNGRLADSGKHSDLIRSNHEYANLYNVQSKYYQKGDEKDGEE
ncbi:ATP-binding cassette domain-containing protein [Oenococcus oeni]|uniref:ATP-binding cassette domain-containing protein n=1 Tax=Oenococcus oeni TaxID=1247 RepID=UPI00050E3843|nr:ABC transporter ATP-binding protein [Oenococcus oeni]KGI01510.1 hypothetical protein X293_06655 [Oenococcus oeni IOEB_C52]